MAAQSRFLAQLFIDNSTNPWLDIEKLETQEANLCYVLFKWEGDSSGTLTSNPLIHLSVQILSKINNMVGRESLLPPCIYGESSLFLFCL